jgi:hypothetical protein
MAVIVALAAVTQLGSGARGGDGDVLTAREIAREWVESRGLREGPDGDRSFIAVGAAPVPDEGDNPELATTIAFELACLDARNAIAEFLSARIGSRAGVRTYVGPSRVPDALGRLNPGDAADPQLHSTYADAVWVLARSEVCALVPIASFRTRSDGDSGMVSVVLRADDRSLALAWALARGEAAQAPADTPTLDAVLSERGTLEQRGVRICRDDAGRACLVAFGYSSIVAEEMSERRALKRAETAATGVLRAFLGQVQAGRSILETSTSLEEAAGRRAIFASEESFRQWMESTAAAVPMPRVRRIREWTIPSTGVPRAVGVAMVLRAGPESGSADDPRAVSSTDGADLRIRDGQVFGRSSGSAVFTARTAADRALHPALRKSRALRAAVVNAKAELARALAQEVSTDVRAASDDSSQSARIRVDIVIRRALLSGVTLVKADFSGTEEQPACTVWVEATAPPDGNALNAGPLGLPRFATEQQAAEAIGRWACDGICDQTMVRVFVGEPGVERLVDFGVGLGAGNGAATVARTKSMAALTSGSEEAISGADSLMQELTAADPLSREGSDEIVREIMRTKRSNTTQGQVRIGGSAESSGRLGIVAVVSWRAP